MSDGIDWDDAFDNSSYVAGAADLPAVWADAAAAWREGASPRVLRYAPHPRAELDLVAPAGTPRGLAVFVHGGYWMRLDRSYWTHLAAGMRGRGFAVAIPSYPLTPEVRLSEITRHIALAITAAAEHVAGPIHLAGHSAGGHLVCRMAAGAHLPPAVVARLARVVSISGLHDLRPFLKAPGMNQTLGLTEAEAAAESPVLTTPRAGLTTAAWVGAEERPELIRQSRLLAEAWPGTGLTLAAGQHHFSVIEPLAEPDAALTALWAGQGPVDAGAANG